MGNMSYCRFQNTLFDMLDCYENWDTDDLSDEEKRAQQRLLKLCINIVEEYVDEESSHD